MTRRGNREFGDEDAVDVLLQVKEIGVSNRDNGNIKAVLAASILAICIIF